MKIEILEPTGIKHEGLGHMQQGEIRVVPDQLGAFFCANGWAADTEGKVATGERGKLDRRNPNDHTSLKQPAIKPAKGTLK